MRFIGFVIVGLMLGLFLGVFAIPALFIIFGLWLIFHQPAVRCR